MTDFEKENFCSLEASHILKEVGFDEGVIAYYPTSGQLVFTMPTVLGMELVRNTDSDNDVAAPTFLSASKWLREKHWVEIFVEWHPGSREQPVFRWYIQTYKSVNALIKRYNSTVSMDEDAEPEAWNSAIIRACEILKERK